MKQSDFDSMLCLGWQKNMKTGFLLNGFIERHGQKKPENFAEAFKILSDNGIERIPTEPFWFRGIGYWLTNAYPQFLNAVLRSNDASKIVLAWLVFKQPTKIDKDYSLNPAKYSAKKYQAARLAGMLQLTQDHGDPLQNRRIKSPMKKRNI